MRKKKHKRNLWLLPFSFTYAILLYFLVALSIVKDIITRWAYHSPIPKMTGLEFEQFVKYILQQNNFHHVEVTPPSNDYGVDILAKKKGVLYAFQCKKYTGKVGISAIQQAATGCAFYEQDVAVVITNSTFTAQAMRLADKLDVELWDEKKLQQLLKATKQIKRRRCLVFFSMLILVILLFSKMYNIV